MDSQRQLVPFPSNTAAEISLQASSILSASGPCNTFMTPFNLTRSQPSLTKIVIANEKIFAYDYCHDNTHSLPHKQFYRLPANELMEHLLDDDDDSDRDRDICGTSEPIIVPAGHCMTVKIVSLIPPDAVTCPKFHLFKMNKCTFFNNFKTFNLCLLNL